MKQLYSVLLLVLFYLYGGLGRVEGQLVAPTQRIWASKVNSSGPNGINIGGSASVPLNAVDGLRQTFSSLNIGVGLLGASSHEEIAFSDDVPDSNYVHIKIGTSSGLLGVGSGLTVTAKDKNGTAVNTTIVNASGGNFTLVSLLNGTNTAEVVLARSSGETKKIRSVDVTYDVTVAGAISSLNLYGAYYETAGDPSTDPYLASDVLAGTETTAILNAASLLSGVANSYNVIDGDTSTYASLSAVANVAAQQQVTALFPGLSPAGTYANILVRDPGDILLNLDVIKGPLIIELLNNGEVVETVNQDNWSLLHLSLLGEGSNKGWLSFESDVPFDGIKVISNSNLVGVLPNFYVYEIQRATSAVVLPVTYTKPLQAVGGQGYVDLSWTTGAEVNNAYFDIQRSRDGQQWSSIGQENSYFPAGTGNGHSYTFRDYEPLLGTGYYRLLQLDFDDRAAAGNVAKVVYNSINSGKFLFFPSRAIDGSVTLRINENTGHAYTLQIVDIGGRIIYGKKLDLANGNNQYSIVPAIKNSGLYLYRLIDSGGNLAYSQKILIP